MRPFPPSPACQTIARRVLPVTRHKCRNYSGLAQKIEQNRSRTEPVPVTRETLLQTRPDPYTLVAPELSHLRGSLLNLLGSAHPGLTDIAEYYFLQPSKQLRSLIVLLFSRATNGLGAQWERKHWDAECETANGLGEELDRPLRSSQVLNEWNPRMNDSTTSFEAVFQLHRPKSYLEPSIPPPLSPMNSALSISPISPPLLLPTQMRLAQIAEMIHVASLLHDGIIKKSDPRTELSEPEGFGNKLSILGGDFLLGRASTALSRLGESEVVELVASVISNLVEGEILRMDDVHTPDLGLVTGPKTANAAWDLYLRKTYLKTASLMAKSARAAVVLGGCQEGEVWKEVSYAYGRNLGIAYQLLEDVLDYEAGVSSLRPGLATGPVLYAWEEHPELQSLIQRNFVNNGDLDLALDFVRRSSGIERSRSLAQAYAEKAREVLHLLPDSDTKMALDVLADMVVKRTW
ncbi:terpenoid synthase [Crucibulum laeve]|uniref:Terpenoid synthase n=1 Tax=Crucibulum laeve TaxID=68775 RepID=A0A5C3MLA9_9AGAR|nr:terpenoid synthase [Crucibulum laeve]